MWPWITFPFAVHSIVINPVFSDHLSYVTLFNVVCVCTYMLYIVGLILLKLYYNDPWHRIKIQINFSDSSPTCFQTRGQLLSTFLQWYQAGPVYTRWSPFILLKLNIGQSTLKVLWLITVFHNIIFFLRQFTLIYTAENLCLSIHYVYIVQNFSLYKLVL